MKAYPALNAKHRSLIADQHVFFVASSPSATDRHVTLSPKRLDSFAVRADDRVACIDLGGRGLDATAHLLVERCPGQLIPVGVLGQAVHIRPEDLSLADQAEAARHDHLTGAPRLAHLELGFYTLEHMPWDGEIPDAHIERFMKQCMAIMSTMMVQGEVRIIDQLLELMETRGGEFLVPESLEEITAQVEELWDLESREPWNTSRTATGRCSSTPWRT